MNIFEWDESIPVTANNLNEMQNIINQNTVDGFQQKPAILWTNSSPNNSFANQTITLNSDDYDCYEVLFLVRSGTNAGQDNSRINSSGLIPKGYGNRIFVSYAGNGGVVVLSRIVDFGSNTTLIFADGFTATGATARTTNNEVIVPIYVIGYKTGLF